MLKDNVLGECQGCLLKTPKYSWQGEYYRVDAIPEPEGRDPYSAVWKSQLAHIKIVSDPAVPDPDFYVPGDVTVSPPWLRRKMVNSRLPQLEFCSLMVKRAPSCEEICS